MLREETVPSPGPGEVRVETIASAVSAGTEMLVYRGEVPQDLPLDLPTLRGSYAFPIKYGYAVAGRVLDTGSNAGHLYPGRPRLRPPPAPGGLRRPRDYAGAPPRRPRPLARRVRRQPGDGPQRRARHALEPRRDGAGPRSWRRRPPRGASPQVGRRGGGASRRPPGEAPEAGARRWR